MLERLGLARRLKPVNLAELSQAAALSVAVYDIMPGVTLQACREAVQGQHAPQVRH